MKRFTLMMMVMCFLMSIPLKMMAEIVTIHFVDEDGWGDYAAYVYDSTKPDDGSSNLLTGKWPGQVAAATDIKDINGNKVVTWKIDTKECASGKARVLFNNNNYNKVEKKYPSSVGWVVKDGLYYYKDGKTSTTPPSGSETGGGSTGGGTEGGDGSATETYNTVTFNRLTEKTRVYSQGFYLAGNFFTFDKKDEINYDDAVFKFQQQTDQDIPIAEGARTVYDVYKVEIPASLKAHAQVMYVDEFGKIKNIFGPGSAYGVSYTNPKTDESTEWLEAKANVCVPITQENTNYWLFASRNETYDEYSDGMYNLYIAVESTTHTIKKWKIEHDSDRRVAYFISDAADATAMPVYDAFDKSHNSNKFSNRFYASVNFSADHNYYVISNYLLAQNCIEWTKKDYETQENGKDYVPTTNKLFLQGNGGSAYDTSKNTNEFSPNEKPMPGGDLGNIIVEYNPSSGNGNLARTDDHLGFRGQIFQQNGRTKITSVSMVGDAIPGTFKEDGSWDFTSKAADMIYDDVEQCYTTTIVTTVGDGEKHFRFVGNHDPKINWFEDTDGTELDKMAKTPYTDPKKDGHSADANDPNKVNYTEDGANPGEEWNILWNRPAGRWTVRLYFYTRNVDGVVQTDYYYTITANHDLVLRDFDDVKYKNEGKRDILLRGGYKFFRTWSDNKAWKVSKDVDIFIVVDKTPKVDNSEFSLKQISGSESANVIPANVGVILATKKDATNIEGGGKFYARPSLTSYNTLVIPMEEYTGEETTADYGNNRLWPMVEAGVVPTYNAEKKEYNYLFGFFRANKGLGVTTYVNNKFLLGFWLSKGAGLFYSNSAYLPVSEATAKKMNLGVSYNDFDVTGAKKAPALLFDFANVGGTTGINEVVNQSTKLNDGKYYTLSGQQVEKPTAGGIYIHNGRKFVVK